MLLVFCYRILVRACDGSVSNLCLACSEIGSESGQNCCVVSVHVVGFCCWMFRGMGINYVKNCLKFVEKVMNMVSWRGLGEVLGALGAPLGTQGGTKSGF